MIGIAADQAGSLVDVPRFAYDATTGGYGDLIHDPAAWKRAAPDALNAALWLAPGAGPAVGRLVGRPVLKLAAPLLPSLGRAAERAALAATLLGSDAAHLAEGTLPEQAARIEQSARAPRAVLSESGRRLYAEPPLPKLTAEQYGSAISGAAELATVGATTSEDMAARLVVKSEKVYPVPSIEPRPFERDYPKGVPGHVGERLKTDIDGQPIPSGAIVVGRRLVGGGEEALSPAEAVALVERLTGSVPLAVPPGRKGLSLRAVGAYTKKRGYRVDEWDRPPYYAQPLWEDGTIKEVVLSDKLSGKSSMLPCRTKLHMASTIGSARRRQRSAFIHSTRWSDCLKDRRRRFMQI